MRRALRKLHESTASFQRLVRQRRRVHVERGAFLTEFAEPGHHIFFGYHDVSPFGADDRLLLAMRRRANASPRAAGTRLELGFFDLADACPTFRPFVETTAWCWQQGCRLQWFSHLSGLRVIHNRTRARRHEAVIRDVSTGAEIAAFDRPIYAMSPSGRQAVSLNFSRLQRLRPGYGYDDIEDATQDMDAPDSDGLWLLDLQSGESRLLVSLAEVAASMSEQTMPGTQHYFNHVVWCPDGNRFAFLHLWRTEDGRRRKRLLVFDLSTNRHTPSGAEGGASHYCWVDTRWLLGTMAQGNEVRYRLIESPMGVIATIGEDSLVRDGHPSVSPANPALAVTDTYPDRLGDQRLMLFNLVSSEIRPVGRFFSPSRFRGEGRCDLHPRWSRGGDHLCVDSAHSGERGLCVIDVREIVQAISGRVAKP